MTRWLFVLALAAPQEAVKFDARSAVGDRATIKIDSGLTLEIATTDSEGEKKRVLTLDTNEVFEQGVLETDRFAVKCVEGARTEVWEGRPPVKTITPLQGKEFRVTAGRVTTDQGAEAPPEAEAIGAWASYALLLPKEEKKVGDSWKIEAKNLGRALWAGFESPEGEVEVRFGEMGKTIANLTLRGRITGMTKEGYEGSLDLGETTFLFDTATGRPVSFHLTGKLELSRRVTEMRPRPGSLTEEDRVDLGGVKVKSTRLFVKVKFESP